MECYVRRSFFTAALRAGRYYRPEKDNFTEALYSVVYFTRTRRAVEAFLAGNTIWTGSKRGDNADHVSLGWEAVFSGASESTIKKLLKAPKETKTQKAMKDAAQVDVASIISWAKEQASKAFGWEPSMEEESTATAVTAEPYGDYDPYDD